MPRGQKAEVGDEKVAANGYHYVRTENQWRLKHHIIAEKARGVPIDYAKERVVFKDGNRTNLSPSNIVVVEKGANRSIRAKLAVVESKIADLQAERELLLRELAND